MIRDRYHHWGILFAKMICHAALSWLNSNHILLFAFSNWIFITSPLYRRFIKYSIYLSEIHNSICVFFRWCAIYSWSVLTNTKWTPSPSISDSYALNHMKFSPRLFEIKLSQRCETVAYFNDYDTFVLAEGEAAMYFNFHTGKYNTTFHIYAYPLWDCCSATESATMGACVRGDTSNEQMYQFLQRYIFS